MASQAFALGTASFSSELVSARGLGQGGVGTAGVDVEATSAFLNPAGMTGLSGTQFLIGGAYVNASPTFTSAVNSTGAGGGVYTQSSAGQVTGARATSVVVPDFGITTQCMDGKLTAGLAVVSPYGLETHFDGDSPLRYSTTDSRLRIIDITPAVAYKVNDMWSVGVAADYYDTVDAQLDKKVSMANLGGSSDANSDLQATGGGWGYHLGGTFKPNAQNQFGLVYHSNVKMQLTGNFNLTNLNGAPGAVNAVFGNGGASTLSGSAAAPVFIPQNLQFGYAFMPNEQWRFEADAAWYDWQDMRALTVNYGTNSTAASTLGAHGTTPFNPRNTLNFAFGANYKANDKLQLRGGAYYEAASTPEAQFDPGLADMPRYGLTAGVGYAFTPSLTGDLGYQAVFFHTREINNPSNGGAPANPALGYSGAFSSFANVIAASLNYKLDTHF
jgi:long-chain fatty acid transport protein